MELGKGSIDYKTLLLRIKFDLDEIKPRTNYIVLKLLTEHRYKVYRQHGGGSKKEGTAFFLKKFKKNLDIKK